MKRTYFIGTLFGAILFLVSACATATPYDASQSGYGFSEPIVENGTYKLSFRGNADTSSDLVKDYLMLRMAEVTLEQGQDYFTVLDTETDCLITVETSPTSKCTVRRPEDAPFPFYELESEPRWFWQNKPKKEYEASAQFSMHTGALPVDTTASFSALDVVEQLGPMKR